MSHRLLVTGLFCASLGWGQLSTFPRPSYFREAFARPVTHVELKGPVRLQDYVVGGKLELSLRSYLELVMANNTDIAYQRLSVSLAQNAITRAFSPFDPALIASFNSQRQKTPPTSLLEGAETLSTLSQPANFRYVQ